MRIVHLTSVLHGGASALIRIHRALRHQGIDSHIFASCPIEDSLEAATQLTAPTLSRWDTLNRKLSSHRNRWEHRIQRAAKKNAPFEAFSPPVALQSFDLSAVLQEADILHIHWTGEIVDYASFFPAIHQPIVWTLHDQNPYLGGFHYQGDVDSATEMLDLEYECRDLKREALADANLTVIGNSRWNSESSRATSVLPPTASVETIYLPLPADEYVALDKPSSKQALGIESNRFVIGFACAAMGNRRKGFADLIHAISALPSSIARQATLVSFGHPPSKSLRQRISIPWMHLGHPSGGVQQSPIYSAMDVFVFPSLEEAFGQTALEAMACRTPVVGTSVGGIPEMVIDGQTGLLAPPRSPRRLAAAVERLYDDCDLRRTMGVAGRQLAHRQHASESIAAQHLALYQRALDSARTNKRAA